MGLSEEIIFKGLLDQCPEKKRKALIKFLPNNIADSISKIVSPSFPFSFKDFSYDHLLEMVHYSWFLPTLKSYDKKDQIILMSALDTSISSSLLDFLKLSKNTLSLSSKSRCFIRKFLLTSLLREDHNLLPINYLPTSPLNILLDLSKHQLIDLIDLLSLFDLASHMHQIIEPKIIKKVFDSLSKQQQKFLKAKMSYKESYLSLPLDIKKMLTSPVVFKKTLHKRGLIRLGQAFGLQNNDLIWYVCHRLDIGRASSLYKIMEKKTKKTTAKILIDQILEVVKILNP